MNLDILRTEWAARDEKLDSILVMNTRLMREVLASRQGEAMRRLLPFGHFSMLFWVATLLLLGSFLISHAGQWRFFVPAAAIFGWTLAMGIVSLAQRRAMRDLDYSGPLLTVQKRLETLRIARIRTFQWAFLTGQIVWWVPFFIVACAALGVDLYASEWMRTFFAINLAVGVIFIPVALWGARAFGRRFGETSLARRLADAIAGADIVAARAFLSRLAQYEENGAWAVDEFT